MQVMSFAAAAFLALLKAIEFFRRGTLSVRLTRDSFFRLIDAGEALFVHAVLLARGGVANYDAQAKGQRQNRSKVLPPGHCRPRRENARVSGSCGTPFLWNKSVTIRLSGFDPASCLYVPSC